MRLLALSFLLATPSLAAPLTVAPADEAGLKTHAPAILAALQAEKIDARFEDGRLTAADPAALVKAARAVVGPKAALVTEAEAAGRHRLHLLEGSPTVLGVVAAKADLESYGGWAVRVTLDEKGKAEFARISGDHVGRLLVVLHGETALMAPKVMERIDGGKVSITLAAGTPAAEAEALAKALAPPAPTPAAPGSTP